MVIQAERTQQIPVGGLSAKPQKAKTPCDRCPRMALWPDWKPGQTRGLDPRNQLAVELYQYCQEDQRVGMFGGAPLLRTVTVEGVIAILDEFSDYLPTKMARQNMLAKIMLIDRVATDVRSKDEETKREARQAAEDAKRERSKELGSR